MEVEQKKEKSCVLKKLERYLSVSMRRRPRSCSSSKAGRVAPTGCFTVYVGPEKQRFVMKTEYANHPLFRMLLEDAESEYGFSSEGPLLLPCDVALFCKVLAEMDAADAGIDGDDDYRFGCGSCSPFNPARRLGRSDMAKGCTSYGLLTPPRAIADQHRRHQSLLSFF